METTATPPPRSAPCNPARPAAVVPAIRSRSGSPLPSRSHTLPTASLLAHLLALPPPLPAPHSAPAAPPQSLPTPLEIHGSSPADPPAPETPGSRPLASAPDPPSGTSVSLSFHTGPLQTAPPLVQLYSNTLAPVPLLRCTTPRPPPPAPLPNSRPAHTPVCSRSLFLSEPLLLFFP